MYKVDFENSVDLDIVPETSAADVLKELMETQNITQIELAKHIKLSQKQLSFILNRKAFMSINVAKRIEKATGVEARWLLELDLNYQLAHQEPEYYADVTTFEWVVSE